MDQLHVFVDEYGDPHLDLSKPGVSSTYIVAALCVRERELERVRSECEEIRRKFFQAGEMKSSSIAANDGRRLNVLRALCKLDAFVIAFCADKEKVDAGSGLAFKKSFIKFFAHALYERITRCASDARILADEHGSAEFQEEFKAYLQRKFKPDLFASITFDCGHSKADALLQVADVFAGSFARIFDEKKLSERAEELKVVLYSKASITHWPSGDEESEVQADEHISADDEHIRTYCVRRVRSYLEGAVAEMGDQDERARLIFLDVLLAHHTLGEPGSFVSTSTLQREISTLLGESFSQHRLRSSVVAKLRDADVIISSCAKGYRIPSSLRDVLEFASFANSQIPPMVARLERARKGVREATLGRVDILQGVNFKSLQAIVEAARG
ncbi:DUF3800 domain-containing protein [Dyella sp. Tek66A03]|uniref:DUF3800 domain-containing protein n=1 Tax=Dyella sp. Tek66A03 TaxID=3458298 RepID=UPI00403EF25B